MSTGKEIGVNYKTFVPELTDISDIQKAFVDYHTGYDWDGTSNPDANSIEGHLKTFDDRIDILEALPISRGVYSSTAPTVVPGTSTAIPAGYIWVDSDDDAAYIYSGSTWKKISANTDTSASYAWSGIHTFSNSVTMSNNVVFSSKFNTFLNPALRAAAITSPQTGLLTFIQQDNLGNPLNKFQYFSGTTWTDVVGDFATNTYVNSTFAPLNVSISASTVSASLSLSDAGKQVEMNVSSANTLTVPTNTTAPFPIGTSIVVLQTGTGQTTITPASTVTINGTPGLKLRARWSAATLIKRATNTWVLVGDTSA